jgi:hypothetical protein
MICAMLTKFHCITNLKKCLQVGFRTFYRASKSSPFNRSPCPVSLSASAASCSLFDWWADREGRTQREIEKERMRERERENSLLSFFLSFSLCFPRVVPLFPLGLPLRPEKKPISADEGHMGRIRCCCYVIPLRLSNHAMPGGRRRRRLQGCDGTKCTKIKLSYRER